MNILVVNDDGIRAPGIRVVVEALKARHVVTVYAPAGERSASSQMITIFEPMRLCPFPWEGARAFEVGGSPADCTKIGVIRAEPKPGLIISGVNSGANLGSDTYYSGTVGAAREGLIWGIPALALSTDMWRTAEYADEAFIGETALKCVDYLEKHPMPARTLLNVNIPNKKRADIKGYAYCPLAFHAYEETLRELTEPDGTYVQYHFKGRTDVDADTDVALFKEGYVTLTPIMWDSTHHTILTAELKRSLEFFAQ